MVNDTALFPPFCPQTNEAGIPKQSQLPTRKNLQTNSHSQRDLATRS